MNKDEIKTEPISFEIYASTESYPSNNICCSHDKELADLRAESSRMVELLIKNKTDAIKTLQNENKKLHEKEKKILNELNCLKKKLFKRDSEQQKKETKLMLEIDSLKEKLRKYEVNSKLTVNSVDILESSKVEF